MGVLLGEGDDLEAIHIDKGFKHTQQRNLLSNSIAIYFQCVKYVKCRSQRHS